ncbi:MAG: hypothetical protein A2Y62_17255 [Candidatus Fischerbacteria bacterium RBG_13_37_8]|uniref:GGDEF domain-containing protein n=1 Tax=Candidatus Fischerbacteria bacterium RBG_13_37_8 TaxID=1817863 RepID=A0A1F5VG51_9BACT|nr:MAG: hypothetical protein A2Y62_17255 [Candidatus Fischerbacteria bacterium RBG_13_37_8]
MNNQTSLIKKLAYLYNSYTVKELLSALDSFLREEFTCDAWDLIKIIPLQRPKATIIHNSFVSQLDPSRKKKYHLSETNITELISLPEIKYRTIIPEQAATSYEKIIAQSFTHALVLPVERQSHHLVIILSLYYTGARQDSSLLMKLSSYKNLLVSSIFKCFLFADLQKRIDRYIVNAKYREFYNDITKIYESTEQPNDFFIKVANEINLFLGTALILYRRWNRHTAKLHIEEFFASYATELQKDASYKLTETISSTSLNKGKNIYKHLTTSSVKFKDENELLHEGIKSLYLVPITAKNEVIGDIIFANNRPDFTRNEINLFREISQYMLSVFSNYHFYNLLNERLNALNLIVKVTQEISSRLDLDQTINETLSSIKEHFGYDNAALLLITLDNKFLYIHSAVGYDPDTIKYLKIKIGEQGITGAAAATGETIIVDDITKDPRYIPGVKGAKWEVALPLKTSNKIIGVLDVESKSDRRIDYAELSTLEIVAAHIAAALSNSLSYQIEAKRASQLSTIHKIARITGTMDNIDSLINKTLQLLQSSFHFHSISVWFYDKYKQILASPIHIGDTSAFIKHEQLMDDGLAGFSAKNKTTILENDLKHNPDYLQSDSLVQSEICVPIIIDDEIYGIIDVRSTTSYAFDTRDQESIETIAGHLATSIKKLLLIEELHKQAITDPLTSLANRRFFNQALTKEIQRSIRTQRTLSLIITDIDNFKDINDAYGHQMGDQVLIKVASIFTVNSRTIDLIARIGGDEFAIILPEANAKQAFDVADRLRHVLSSTHIEPIGYITASFGISTFSALFHNADEFITQADNAMYQAKKLGRNRVFKG